ncbi:hypothetical protein [Rhodococcus erythropolis]|uniref:hypothetical protein n=1 Tax=Rhodococcus erythropolis TaxID=1833 RepID=UPI00366BAE2D
MYWTPAWGIVLASMTGIVSVLGTVGGVVLTLRHSRKESEADRTAANIRHQRELRERHAERQRTALSDLFLHYLEFTNKVSLVGDELHPISNKSDEQKDAHRAHLAHVFEEYTLAYSRFRVASDAVRVVAKGASYLVQIDALDSQAIDLNEALYSESDRVYRNAFAELNLEAVESAAGLSADLYRQLVEAAGTHIEKMLNIESPA